jgi:hypothetical protein
VATVDGNTGSKLYELYAGGKRKNGSEREPICGKGTAYKIKYMYQRGELKEYLASVHFQEDTATDTEESATENEVATIAPTGSVARRSVKDIQKLASIMEPQLGVPKPGTPLLSHRDIEGPTVQARMDEAIQSGDTHSFMEPWITIMRYPWWRSDVPPKIQLNLNSRQQVLLRSLSNSQTSRAFKGALEKWIQEATSYLELVLYNAADAEIDEAYRKGDQAAMDARLALWEAVAAL